MNCAYSEPGALVDYSESVVHLLNMIGNMKVIYNEWKQHDGDGDGDVMCRM